MRNRKAIMEILLRQGLSTHKANRIADEMMGADLRTEDVKEIKKDKKQVNLFDKQEVIKNKKQEDK